MLVYRLPKAKANTHPSTHQPSPLQSRTLSIATLSPTTLASSTKHFDIRPLTFFSALHNISRPAFLATSFTLFLRSIASQRNSLYACVLHTSPPTTFYHHINLLPSDIGVLGSPKKTWVHRWRHQGFLVIEQQRHQQSNLPYRDKLFPQQHRHHLYNYQTWAYISNRRFSVKDLLTA